MMRIATRHVWLAAILFAAGVQLNAIENVTLFRVILNDGTAVVSYGEYARVGDRVVFSMPIGTANAASAAIPNLHVVNLPASAVDWVATSKYAESARYSHYVATTAEADYAALTGEVASVLNSVMFTKDPAARLNLATQARRRLASWPQDHYGYRSNDVREVLGLLDEVISDLRASAGDTTFSLELVADVEPFRPQPMMADPTPAESIAQAMAVAKVADVVADRVSILRATVAAIDDPRNGVAGIATKSTREWAVRTIGEEAAIDRRYSKLASTMVRRASAAAADAKVGGAEAILATAEQRDAAWGRQRPDLMLALLTQVHVQLDAARRLHLARDHWRERIGSFRAYQKAVAPVFGVLHAAQKPLGDIERLAGPDQDALLSLKDRLRESSRRLDAVTVPAELKLTQSLLQSAMNLADNAVRTRQQAVTSGSLTSAWDASSAAAGSIMLLAKAKEDLEAVVALPHIR
jgi:hypothetical protein